MLAKLFNTTIVDVNFFYAPRLQYLQYNKDEKFKLILYKGVQNILFLYEKNEMEFFWDLFKSTFLDYQRLNWE